MWQTFPAMIMAAGRAALDAAAVAADTARQFILGSGTYVNATASRQWIGPGGTYVNE